MESMNLDFFVLFEKEIEKKISMLINGMHHSLTTVKFRLLATKTWLSFFPWFRRLLFSLHSRGFRSIIQDILLRFFIQEGNWFCHEDKKRRKHDFVENLEEHGQ
jgi:hypothetical protein